MTAPLPRVTISEHPLPHADDTLHLTVLSDLHIDSPLCDYDGLKKMLKARSRLQNHVVCGIGDMADLVMPTDMKRFRPSVQKPHIATRDDWFAAALEEVGGLLEELKVVWLFIGRGNHEDEAMKRHGWDSTSVLAARLGCKPAGYSGVHDLRLKRGSAQTTFRLAWHHGAWGGAYAKGYNSALGYFSTIDSWHCAVWGHNHASRVDPEVRLSPDPAAGLLRERRVYLMACGSGVAQQSGDGRITHRTERHGAQPQPRQSPLIKIKLRRQKAGGVERNEPEYTVEV